MKPYAIYLLERFRAGESEEQLAVKERISIERIRMRLAAAVEFERRGLAITYGAAETKIAA